ncbi:hypothetical protein [Rhodococcus aetherivorans]|uniref:hypothetical protein n=1 Tax=Rhodococcus aetherivorans TaxID=191292 RepID=UPI0016398108|nr:hypothetical protein [Rhodococcus aetherivorans]MBC2586917.1 hypothetical protein [Rhodococcus aetherivorans]
MILTKSCRNGGYMNTTRKHRRNESGSARRAALALAAGTVAMAGGFVGLAGTTSAAPVEHSSETYTFSYTFDGPVTCNGGPTYTLTNTVTLTDYYLENPGGRRVIRAVITESLTGVPLDPSLPTVTATTEGQGTGSTSTQGAFTNTYHGKTIATYSDGSTESASFIGHATVSPYYQKILRFDRCH